MSDNRKNDSFSKAVEQSKGEQIIGRFNSENKTEVDLIKEKAIELVNLIEEFGKDPRRKAAAITQIESGVMMGIKSLFN